MILVLLLGLIGPLAYARDVIVHLADIDGTFVREADVRARVKYLARLNPGARIIDFAVRTNLERGHTLEEREAWRQDIRARIARVEWGEDRITMLILNTHGAGGDTGTSLGLFGRIFASGPNRSFRRVLTPLRGYVRDDARVVILSCSSLRGDEAAARARVEALWRWFGISDGSFVGFTGPAWAIPARGGLTRWDGFNAFRIGVGATLYTALLQFDWTLAAGVGTLAPALYLPLLSGWRARQFRRDLDRYHAEVEHNEGLILTARGGRVIGAQDFRYPEHYDVMLSCARRLL